MNRNVPKLRFKEFEDEWQNKRVEEVTNYVDYRGKTPIKTDSGRFLVTAKNIKMGYIDYEKSKEFISEESYSEVMRRGTPKMGDVLLTTEAPLGNIAQIDREDIALAQRVIKFRGTEELDNSYLKQYFLSDKFQRKLINKAIGTTVLGIQGKVLHKMEINIPSLIEQEKIVDFFTILDNLIEEQDGKVRDLEIYKKGMMQKIFSQEIRFKDENGSDYPEWKKQKISEFALIRGGYAFKSKDFTTKKVQYQIIKMGNLYKNELLLSKSPSYKENISEKEKEYLLKKNDIIITLTGTVGKRDFGYSYLITDEKNLLLNQRLGLIRTKNDKVNSFFIKNVLLEEQFLLQFFESSVGGTGNQANVSTKNIESFKIYLPCLQEQTKIADFLFNIDNLIKEEKKNLDDLRKMKKGLLQQMFV